MIDLVMGAARGYSAEQVRPFLMSLRGTGYRGRIVMWADGEAVQEGARWEAEMLPCPSVRTLPHAERFYWVERELARARASGVFLTDTRDVLFQKNPEDHLPSQGLHAFEEAEMMTIGSCPYNSEWMRLGYGKEELEKCRWFPILCVGSICGDLEAVRKHVGKLCGELRECQPRTHKPQDQSCHNYLIRHSETVTIWSNEGGEVYTVGYLPRESVAVIDGAVVNLAGKVPAVIHQWDRHQNLSELVRDLYS